MKSHPASKRIRLDRALSYPRVPRKARPSRGITSEFSLPDAISIDEVTTQTLEYLAVFEKHVAVIRDHPEQSDAFERLLKKRGAPHPQQLVSYEEQEELRVKMEELIRSRATTVDEQVLSLSHCHILTMKFQTPCDMLCRKHSPPLTGGDG